jgi:hypothetical protein
VVASPTEQTLITTDPQALLDAQRAAELVQETEKNLAAQGGDNGVRNGYLSEKEIKGV